jgi:regulator of protease activity HflC (stomatin/prohibitin superfamily)
MNVDELLDLMEETLEEGTAMPFSAGKRVVDVDKIRDIVDDVRANLPDEMRQSKKIVAEREQIIADAQREADGLVKQAEERSKLMVSDQEIVKRAQKRAVEILTTAQGQAREISKSATAYCENILKNSEEVMARSIADIKNTRMNLRNAGSRPHHPGKA